ncbi:MAG: DUF63 family protein [Candidatus Aenigmarchaeota archaeon]|nr:DUF63 family protein [Candidatus Aenigmarchaeota archaeon]
MPNPLYDYFIAPMLANGYFNPVNTLVYGVILVIAVLAVYKLMQRMKVRIDRHFFYAILPFIFWGSSTRVLHDAAYVGRLATDGLNAFYNQSFFPTPGSYFITFGLAIGVLALCLAIQRFRKAPYWKPMLAIGLVLDAVNVLMLPALTLLPLLMMLATTGFWMLLFYLIYRLTIVWGHMKPARKYFSGVNQAILGSHLLDASGTFTAMSFFGYGEQHVVPNLLIPAFGPVSMFALKIVVVLPVLWAIDRWGYERVTDKKGRKVESRDFGNFLKIVVLILGLAPALRNMLRLICLV